MKGKLLLEDGSVFNGVLLDGGKATGEVVFNTGMTGYQEILSDPSYCSQIITLTYPLIGNYGVAERFMQSRQSFANGLVVGELCEEGSSCHMTQELADFLREQKVPCLSEVDTRALTRHIRAAGTMKGVIVPADASTEEIDKLMNVPIEREVVAKVTVPECYEIAGGGSHIAVLDFGIKNNILNAMKNYLGCRLTVFPALTPPEEVLAIKPDAVFLSNGPGDPKAVPDIIANIKRLLAISGNLPIFGICLGHQLLALAFGADTYKLKFGHRGSNQPVKNILTGKVQITSQNHGYAVSEESLKNLPVEITHINVNDGTVEGIRYKERPIFSVQYHPEAAPGPDDNVYLFDQFNDMITKGMRW